METTVGTFWIPCHCCHRMGFIHRMGFRPTKRVRAKDDFSKTIGVSQNPFIFGTTSPEVHTMRNGQLQSSPGNARRVVHKMLHGAQPRFPYMGLESWITHPLVWPGAGHPINREHWLLWKTVTTSPNKCDLVLPVLRVSIIL